MKNDISDLAIRRAEAIADPHAKKYVRPSYLGCVDSAGDLACALRNELRGRFAVDMWRNGVRCEAYRAFLMLAWSQDHGYVLRFARSRRTVAAMFRHAKFDVPTSMGERLVVWRGAADVSAHVAGLGFSWTANRDVACWFAIRSAKNGHVPIVVSADISRDQIAMYDDGRSEQEIVLTQSPQKYRVDGELSDWMAAAKRHVEGMRRIESEAQAIAA